MKRTRRHPAEVLADQLGGAYEKYYDKLDGAELDMIGQLKHAFDEIAEGKRWANEDCLCWVGHGGCGGCSGVIGIAHEPACGWEWNPDCPGHPPQRQVIGLRRDMSDTWEYGIRFDAMPTDVVLGREANADGSVTRTMWQAGGLSMCEQIMRSPAPLSHIKGTKHIVRRRVGPVEVYSA